MSKNNNQQTYWIVGTGTVTNRTKKNIYVLNHASTDLVSVTRCHTGGAKREDSEGSPACPVSDPSCEELVMVMVVANGSVGGGQSGRAAIFV